VPQTSPDFWYKIPVTKISQEVINPKAERTPFGFFSWIWVDLAIGFKISSTAFGVVGILSLSFFPRVSPAVIEKFDPCRGRELETKEDRKPRFLRLGLKETTTVKPSNL